MPATTTEPMTENTTLELAPVTPGEPPMKQIAVWEPFNEQLEKLVATAETLTVTDVTQVAQMGIAREVRLKIRTIRLSVDDKRKEWKEEHLRAGQRIDRDAKVIKDKCEALEERLLEQEKFIERETLRLEDNRRETRAAELTPLLSGPLAVDLGKLTDEQYAGLLSDTKAAYEAKLAREKKEAEETAARIKAEAEEQERIRVENEKLKQEAAEREAAAKAEREAAAAEAAKLKAEAEEAARVAKEAADKEAARLRAEAEKAAEAARKEREAIEAKAAAERAQAEAAAKAEREAAAKREQEIAAAAKRERELAEAKAEEEREAAAKKAREEREAREKVEAELAAKKAAEQKAETDRLAALEAAAMAPEKDKLNALAKVVRELPLPKLETEKGAALMQEITAKFEAFAAWIEKKGGTL